MALQTHSKTSKTSKTSSPLNARSAGWPAWLPPLVGVLGNAVFSCAGFGARWCQSHLHTLPTAAQRCAVLCHATGTGRGSGTAHPGWSDPRNAKHWLGTARPAPRGVCSRCCSWVVGATGVFSALGHRSPSKVPEVKNWRFGVSLGSGMNLWWAQ